MTVKPAKPHVPACIIKTLDGDRRVAMNYDTLCRIEDGTGKTLYQLAMEISRYSAPKDADEVTRAAAAASFSVATASKLLASCLNVEPVELTGLVPLNKLSEAFNDLMPALSDVIEGLNPSAQPGATEASSSPHPLAALPASEPGQGSN